MYNDVKYTEYELVFPYDAYLVLGRRITAYGRVGFPLFRVEDIKSIYNIKADFELALSVVGVDDVGCYRYHTDEKIEYGKFVTLDGLEYLMSSLEEVSE